MGNRQRVRADDQHIDFDELEYGDAVAAAKAAIESQRREADLEFFEDESNYASIAPASPPGDPRECIHNLLRLLRATPGLLVVIYCRVSWREKSRREGLRRQVERLRNFIEASGGRVIDDFSEEASGWKSDADEREELVKAAKLAKRRGAVLAAEYVDRFIRNQFYDCALRPGIGPSVSDLQHLEELTLGVPLATMISPAIKPETADYLRAVDASTNRRIDLGDLQRFVIDRHGMTRQRSSRRLDWSLAACR